MANNYKRKTISLAEFRAWLQGVEELQPKDWSPNHEQWKLIRAKIETISLKEKVVEAVAQPTQTTPSIQRSVPVTIMPAPDIPSGIPPSASSLAVPRLQNGGLPVGNDGKMTMNVKPDGSSPFV